VQTIGRYEVLEEIARGGMGVVYRAHDPAGRDVALKLLLSPAVDPRFAQEAQALAQLNHPGIVRVHAFDVDASGRPYLVMELVEGESLQGQLSRAGPLPVDRVLEVGRALCDALAYAHERGVIHRDLKPGNVLVTPDGTVKLTDFGLAKVVNQSQSLTQTGEVMGTPAFMPPEQVEGDKAALGPHSDVYGLGATLYALLTARPPFKAPTVVELLQAVLQDGARAPSKHCADVPAWLDACVLRCLAKRSQDRFASMDALSAALASPSSGGVRGGTRPWAAAASVLLLGGVLAAVVLARGRTQAAAGGVASSAGDPSPPTTPPPSASALPSPSPSREPSPPPPEEPAPAAPVTPELPNVEPLIRLGNAHYNEKRYAEAIEAYSEAIRLRPDYMDLFHNRGTARKGLEDYPGAIADYTEALRLEPTASGARLYRGRCRAALQDYSGALEDFDELIRSDPLPEAFYSRGVVRLRLRDFEGALADLERALDREPEASWAPHARRVIERARQRDTGRRSPR
jgi:serine/threonine protein kinase